MNINWAGTAITLLTFFGIYAIIALSLNLEYGLTGIPNFGKALFVSLGAYTTGFTYTRLLPLLAGQAALDPCGDETLGQALQIRMNIVSGQPGITLLNFGLTLLIAVALGGIVGFLVSYTALRVKEEWYLGLVLLVGSEATRIIVGGYDPLMCGKNGINITQPFSAIQTAT